MRKIYFTGMFLFLGIATAHANSEKIFQSPDINQRACKLVKFSGGKWVATVENDVDGQKVSNVSQSKANAEYSNFKWQNIWFAAKSECIKDLATAKTISDESTADIQVKKHIFISAEVSKFLMLGNNMGVTTYAPDAGITATSTAYSSDVGFGGRVGYEFNDHCSLIFDVSHFGGSQNIQIGGNYVGADEASENILKVNVGVQAPVFHPVIWDLQPYVAALVGYAHLSGQITGPIQASGGPAGGTLGIGYSASGFDFVLEAGVSKEFATHWSALFNVGYNYLSFNPKINQTNGVYPNGSTLNSKGYSNLGFSLGARYDF
jgi:hypothetical protein